MATFRGRSEELNSLRSLINFKKASLAVILGRRRIGKSSLVHEFSKEFKKFYEFHGLAPRKSTNNLTQLNNFAAQLKEQFGGAVTKLTSWDEAFDQLYKELLSSAHKKTTLLFFDELSWMGKYDQDFAGKLKIAWDTKFSKIPNLIMILCGSVSSWIQNNILQSTGFVGRVSLTLRLGELDLKNSIKFWGEKSDQISIFERLNYLCVTGGIPKYLEEYDLKNSTADNLKRLCFTKGGYLFEDFERIFNDIFEKKSELYKKITKVIAEKNYTAQEISDTLKISSSGEFIKSLQDLELSGFITRDYTYKPNGLRSKLSKYRISDNYLRFYLKYIDKNTDKINKDIFKFTSFSDLLSWESILGLQFENLILNRIPDLLRALGLENEKIISASPYFQNRTNKTKACQIDLLIECKPNNFFICEIKYRKQITTKVIEEVKNKIASLKLPKYCSKRAVLIYAGELNEGVKESEYFDKIIEFSDLLK